MKNTKFFQPLQRLLASPVVGDSDPESLRQVQLTTLLVRVLLGASMLTYLLMFTASSPLAIFVLATSMLLINLTSLYLLQSGRMRAAQVLLVIGIFSALSAAALYAGGVLNTPYPALILVVIVAGVMLGNVAGLVVAGAATFVGMLLVVLELNDALPNAILVASPIRFWFAMTLVFFACTGLIALVTNSLKQVAAEAQQNAQAKEESLAELQEIRLSLEDQVQQRTRELEQRTRYLQAILDVAQSTAALLDSDQVIRSAVELIQEQFQLYYVGLFQVDPSGDWAVLKAGTGEAGRAMLARGHRIHVGSGMIGWSIANAQPRIAGEAGRDLVRLSTAELPETRSEAAVPLRSRGRVIGALSVQSERYDAFGEVEIASFQALADQVAIALDNARLYSESRAALDEAQRAYGQLSQRSWQEFLQTTDQQGHTYRYGANENALEAGQTERVISAPQTHALSLAPNHAYLSARQQAQASGRPVQIHHGAQAILFLPIPVREVQIGVISFTKDLSRSSAGMPPFRTAGWTLDEIELLQSIVEQMGVALDSARLYQDTQRLAYRQQVTGEVTARIRQTLDIQTVLRTAVEEIQRTLGLPEVLISLTPVEEDAPRVEVED